MKCKTALTESFHIDFPVIMAPMFLVSNVEMVKAAMRSGIIGTFPSLNFREKGELEKVLEELNRFAKETGGVYGVNLIAQRSNPFYEKHLAICVEQKVPFYITSLGNPKRVIEASKSYGAKVYCDVTNLMHARKVYDLGCDGMIAVGQGAGGHSGTNPLQVLVPALIREFPGMPVVAAGGVATGAGVLSMLALGAAGVSIGTRFIASKECSVNDAYKNAVVQYGMDDIVMSSKISGTPATVINTPYAKKIGYKQNFIEKALTKNRTTRKYFKMWVQYAGIKKLEKSILPGTYKTLWIAGKSSGLIEEVKPVGEIVENIKNETYTAMKSLNKLFEVSA